MHSTPNTSPTSWLTIVSYVRAYGKKILVGKLATLIEQEICRICEANTWTIGALHMHLFLNAPPNVSPSQIAHTLKGTTARKVFQHFPEVKKYLWAGARHGPVRTTWAVWEL